MPRITFKASSTHGKNEIRVSDEGAIALEERTISFSRDGKCVVKIYPGLTRALAAKRENILKNNLFRIQRSKDEEFIVPSLALVERMDGQPRTRFLRSRVPESCFPLSKHILDEEVIAAHFNQGETWAKYLKVARSIATAIHVQPDFDVTPSFGVVDVLLWRIVNETE